MDRKHFDALARFVATKTTRRSAFATLVGASLVGSVPEASDAKRNHHAKRRRRRRRRNRTCYPGTGCVLGQNGNGENCDFSGSTAFQGADLRFANLAGANLSNINAMNADLRGANLRGACIVESVLFEAQLGTAKLDGAIFCNTVMPDGTINTSGCERATECCPPCASGECAPQGTCAPLGNICSNLPFGDKCCGDSKCVPPVPSKWWWVTWCQDTQGCTTSEQCKSRFPNYDVTCMDDDFLGCPGLVNKCCRMQECIISDHCPHSGVCCSFLDLGIARCCAPGQRCTLIGCL
jgi:hypothetical protein